MLPLLLLAALAASPTTGNLVVTSDTPFALFVDGRQVNVANVRESWTVRDLAAGRHAIKVEAWPSPFKRVRLVDGYLDIPGGTEVRVRAAKDTLEVYETISLLPAAPPPVAVVATAPGAVVTTGSAVLSVQVPGAQLVVTQPAEPVVVVEAHHSERRGHIGHDHGHGRPGAHPREMGPGDFASLLAAVEEESFEDKKLDVLSLAAGSAWLSVEQVGQLVDRFDFSKGKVRALEICQPRLSDPQNGFRLLSHFEFEADKKRARQILGR